jgi:hypothetical protein
MMRMLVVPALLVACGACFAAVTEVSMPSAEPVAANVDMSALHMQANGALEKLRQQQTASANAIATF